MCGKRQTLRRCRERDIADMMALLRIAREESKDTGLDADISDERMERMLRAALSLLETQPSFTCAELVAAYARMWHAVEPRAGKLVTTPTAGRFLRIGLAFLLDSDLADLEHELGEHPSRRRQRRPDEQVPRYWLLPEKTWTTLLRELSGPEPMEGAR